MNMDMTTGSKRPRQEVAPMEEKHLTSPTPLHRPADLAAARQEQHLAWARGIPTAPPHREETESSVAVLSNVAEPYLSLVDLIHQSNSLCCLVVDFGRSKGKFLIKGLTPPLWNELRLLVSGLRPLDEELPVELRAPLRFISREELAVRVQLPFEMDPNSFALGLKFNENETRPIALAPVLVNGEVTNVIKMYCASKSHKKKILSKRTIRWSKKKLTVSSFGSGNSRKTRRNRAGRNRN